MGNKFDIAAENSEGDICSISVVASSRREAVIKSKSYFDNLKYNTYFIIEIKYSTKEDDED